MRLLFYAELGNAHFDGPTTIVSGCAVHEHVYSICLRLFALSDRPRRYGEALFVLKCIPGLTVCYVVTQAHFIARYTLFVNSCKKWTNRQKCYETRIECRAFLRTGFSFCVVFARQSGRWTKHKGIFRCSERIFMLLAKTAADEE